MLKWGIASRRGSASSNGGLIPINGLSPSIEEVGATL